MLGDVWANAEVAPSHEANALTPRIAINNFDLCMRSRKKKLLLLFSLTARTHKFASPYRLNTDFKQQNFRR
jgi:hypothetical protein